MYAIAELDREECLVKHAPLVKRIAYHLMAKLPASVLVEDMIQVGMIGLLDAVSNYDGSQGAQFETYAVQRIRGAMLDELRQGDWLPRSARKNMRRIESAMHALEQRHARTPTEGEIAKELEVSLAEYQQMLLDARGTQLVHYEDFRDGDEDNFLEHHVTDERANPLEQLEDEGFRAHLVTAIDGLPEREKLMMAMYYEQELNLREIGEVLGVSESRVCQLHSQAVTRLRSHLREWLVDGR